ncbi:MAG: hypothetical protein WC565_08275, partial [Parcubacteria group bacterium]
EPKAKAEPKAKTRKPRAGGLSLKDKIKSVMGRSILNAGEVLERLEEKGLMPESNNPRQYVSMVLSSCHEMFERATSKGRGYYRVKVDSDNGMKTAAPTPTTEELLAELPDNLQPS